MKRAWLALTGLLALAMALRLINLGGRPLWYDEAFAVLYASRSASEILYGTLARVQGAAADVHPVLYYFALHGWMRLFGQTPVSVRIPSVLLGVGTVIAVWGLARELFDDRVALLSAAFTAGSPFLIAYSQETRMYALLGFWSVAAFWTFVRATRTGSARAWLAFIVCGTLALYSHNLGFLTVAVVGVFVVARAVLSGPTERRQRWAGVAKTALAGLAMAVLFAPWLALVPSQFGKIEQAYWVTRPDFKTLVQTLIVFSFDFENAIFPPSLIAPALFGAVLLLVVVIVQVVILSGAKNPLTLLKTSLVHTGQGPFAAPSLRSGLWLRARSERSQGVTDGTDGACPRFGVWLLATLGLVPVLALFLISQWRPVYVIRGLLPAATCYLVLAAWAVVQMPRVARYALLAILAVLVGATLASYYGYQDFPRGPFVELDAVLRARMQPGDVIVHSNKLTYFPAHYYDRALPQAFLGDPPGSGSDTLAYPTQQALGLYATTLDAATSGARRVWLVIFKQAIAEIEGVHPHVAWLEAHGTQAETLAIGDMDVMLFVQKER